MTAVLRARGHPRVTATHAKTFELATDADIGGEATCVIGVGTTADWDALGRLHGPVRLTLEAGGLRQSVVAAASPFWSRGHGLVVRRSDFRGDDTLATDADTAAADLDRGLVAALADPATELTVTVAPLDDPPDTVLFTDRLEPRVADGVRVVGLPAGHVALDDVELVLARPGAAIAAGAALLGVTGDVVLLGPKSKRPAQQPAAQVTAGTAPDDAGASAVFRPGEVVAPVRLGPPTQRVNKEDRVFSIWAGQPQGAVDPLLQALLDEGVSPRTLRQAAARVGRTLDYGDLGLGS